MYHVWFRNDVIDKNWNGYDPWANNQSNCNSTHLTNPGGSLRKTTIQLLMNQKNQIKSSKTNNWSRNRRINWENYTLTYLLVQAFNDTTIWYDDPRGCLGTYFTTYYFSIVDYLLLLLNKNKNIKGWHVIKKKKKINVKRIHKFVMKWFLK